MQSIVLEMFILSQGISSTRLFHVKQEFIILKLSKKINQKDILDFIFIPISYHVKMSRAQLLITLCFVPCALSVEGAKNILFFNGFASYSHFVAFEPLAKSLADLNHSVTILSPILPKNPHPKIRSYCPQSVLDHQNQLDTDLGKELVLARIRDKNSNLLTQTSIWGDESVRMCQRYYRSIEFKNWIRSTRFDLLIIDTFSRECALPLAHLWGAKTIVFSSSTLFYAEQDTFGFPTEASWVMSYETEEKSSMFSLPESLYYDWTSVKWFLWRKWKYLPRFDELVQSELSNCCENGTKVPKITDLEKDVSLYFLNTHYSSEYTRSIPNFVIPVGGMHCRESKQGIQDKRIRDFVDNENSDGFIYISFGSFFRISALPPRNQKMFFDTMTNFPSLKFLVKWEGNEFPKSELPSNVFISQWFPQQDILAHEKCRGFVSQGGLMSLQQSIFHLVPMIIIPFAGDQTYYARIASKMGFGIYLEISELTVPSFTRVIRALLRNNSNNKYTRKVTELSRISRDRPMSPTDTAVWWTLYVLRHDYEHLQHLKSPGLAQSWWQRRLLHVYVIGSFLTLFLSSCLVLFIIWFFQFIHREKSPRVVQQMIHQFHNKNDNKPKHSKKKTFKTQNKLKLRL